MAVPASNISWPISSAAYMYHRRSVEDAPFSPTAARSRAAITKWTAQMASNTAALHAACAVSRLSAAWLSSAGLSPVVSALSRVIANATEKTRHAQYR